jgi:hypothetical protein
MCAFSLDADEIEFFFALSFKPAKKINKLD